MLTIHDRPEFVEFFHGSALTDLDRLLPPNQTGVLSEDSRKKNLDRVFFTRDRGLAEVYARRAVNSYGGTATVYRVVMPVDTVLLSAVDGASVYHAKAAFLEKIDTLKISTRTNKKRK
jgi:hypothetical protein